MAIAYVSTSSSLLEAQEHARCSPSRLLLADYNYKISNNGVPVQHGHVYPQDCELSSVSAVGPKAAQ